MIRHSPALRLLVACGLAACAGAPADGIARCPAPPDPAVLASLEPVTRSGGNAVNGEIVFERECTRCHSHSLAGRGSRFFHDYPRLDCREYLEQASDAYLLRVIADGGPAAGRDEAMKPFRDVLGDRGLADVIAYLRGPGAAPR